MIPNTLHGKLIAIVSILVLMALLAQGVISGSMVQSALDDIAHEHLKDDARVRIALLEAVMQRSQEDIAVIRAHADIENLFAAREFEDSDGVTEALANLEIFFNRIYKAKPQYQRILLTTGDNGQVLEVAIGERRVRPSGTTVKSVPPTLPKERQVTHWVTIVPNKGWELHSAGSIELANRLLGIIHIVQPMDELLVKMLKNRNNNKITVMIIDDKSRMVAHSADGDSKLFTSFLAGKYADWLTINENIPGLGWKITLGMEKSGIFAVLDRLFISGLLSAIGLILILSWFIRHVIIKRLLSIRNTIQTIANGDLSTRLQLAKNPDEIDDICGNVNVMADRLDQNIHALENERNLAESANSTKTHFLANMSHEIRTPMNAIIGLSNLALETKMTEKQYDYLDKINTSAHNLLSIINDILDFSKIEANKLDIECIPFQLDEVLQQLADLVGLRAAQKGLELLFSCDPNIPTTLLGDPLRLGQILTNLTSNAIKFTDQGEIIITASIVKKDSENVQLSFTIKDTGIGMSQEQIGKLFQSFTQADGTTTRKYGGTGLGLAISKRLTQLMGGEIKVSSKQNEGSIFSISITMGCLAHSKPPLPPERFKQLRVLILDDNLSARTILQKMVLSLSFNAVAYDSINSLQPTLQNADTTLPFDLLMLDWDIGDNTKEEQIKIIRRNQQLTNTVILFMAPPTILGKDIDKINAAPQENLIIKPINASTLFDTFMDIFGVAARKHDPIPKHLILDTQKLNGLRGVKVLLAEDNLINQQVAQEVLEQVGIIVKIANNGDEAVKAVEQENFDAILMDIQMPVMDGYEATQKIRLLKGGDDLPIIAMTAHAMVGDREKCLAKNMNDHVPKPTEPINLYTVLLKWITPKNLEFNDSEIHITTNKQDSSYEDKLKQNELINIDLESGLRRVGGNHKLLHKLLNEFRDDYQDGAARVKSSITNNNLDEARILVHTIKGAAGNLGAKELFSTAIKLEDSLKTTNINHETAELFYKNMDSIIVTLSSLDAVESRSIDYSPHPTIDKVELMPMLNELKILLDQGNTKASFVLDKIYPVVGSAYKENFITLEEQIDDFEFDEALQTLATFINTMENS
jgi:signal transduction histidine kinase/CheY-like chemotaxis protein